MGGGARARRPGSTTPAGSQTTGGCRAFTLEPRDIIWLGNFKPDLLPCYDGTADPAEFLQLYELSIEAANRD